MVEAGAKAAIVPGPITSDRRRAFPARVRLRSCDADAAGGAAARARQRRRRSARLRRVPVQMVFIGTCTGGRAVDFREAWDAFARAGGRLANGVQLVLTPASRDVHDQIVADGTLDRFVAAGAILTDHRLRRLLRDERRHSWRRDDRAVHRQSQLQSTHGKRDRADLSGVAVGLRRRRRNRQHPGARMTHSRPRARRRRRRQHRLHHLVVSQTRDDRCPAAGAVSARGVAPAFAASVQPGDVLVGGKNFGCGSAMEVAVTVIQAAGIGAVVGAKFRQKFLPQCDQQRAARRRVRHQRVSGRRQAHGSGQRWRGADSQRDSRCDGSGEPDAGDRPGAHPARRAGAVPRGSRLVRALI